MGEDLVTPVKAVSNGASRRLTERYDPLFPPLSRHPHELIAEINICKV